VRPSDPILDARVARRTFAEAEELYSNRATFASIAWSIAPPEFPELRVDRIGPTGQSLIGVVLHLRNYDFLPASVRYVKPNGEAYGWPELAPLVKSFPDPSGGLPRRRIVEATSTTGLPFLCLPGTYEYHAHIQHRRDRWDDHRGQISLQSVLFNAFDALALPGS
jgi:hypothetical protein